MKIERMQTNAASYRKRSAPSTFFLKIFSILLRFAFFFSSGRSKHKLKISALNKQIVIKSKGLVLVHHTIAVEKCCQDLAVIETKPTHSA